MRPSWESSPRGRHAGPTWTAHVPAALAGSHSAPSARPATAAASAPGYGPRPTAGVNGAESIGVTLGWASLPCRLLWTSHSCCSSVRMILLESNSCLSFEAFQMLSSGGPAPPGEHPFFASSCGKRRGILLPLPSKSTHPPMPQATDPPINPPTRIFP